MLKEGTTAPAFKTTDANGETVSLKDFRGQKVVLYFYPKDDTPGCTKEACAFRDAFEKFVKAGVTIFAVSRDGDVSHRAFREHYKLPFPMVADPSGAVQRAYGVPGDAVAQRITFLVGPDGKIARVWPKVDPVVNATEVLDEVTARKGKRGS
jgi:peroxiredoxin Q/BCP